MWYVTILHTTLWWVVNILCMMRSLSNNVVIPTSFPILLTENQKHFPCILSLYLYLVIPTSFPILRNDGTNSNRAADGANV